jgi:hypothetical protein
LHLFPGLEQLAWITTLPYAIMTALLIIILVQVICLARNDNLASAFTNIPERDAMLLVIGAALIAGCFLAGQSVGYRGVHLIFVIAGLIAMTRAADNPAMRAMLTRTTMMVVFLMWEGLFRQALQGVTDAGFAVFWLIREVFWWRLTALLLALIVIFGVKSEVVTALQQWRRSESRSNPCQAR